MKKRRRRDEAKHFFWFMRHYVGVIKCDDELDSSLRRLEVIRATHILASQVSSERAYIASLRLFVCDDICSVPQLSSMCVYM